MVFLAETFINMALNTWVRVVFGQKACLNSNCLGKEGIEPCLFLEVST